MILLLLLYLKDILFIALCSNMYHGEHIYDNHLVLKFIPTIKTHKCLYDRTMINNSIKIHFHNQNYQAYLYESMSQVCVHQMYTHLSDLLCYITFVALFFLWS